MIQDTPANRRICTVIALFIGLLQVHILKGAWSGQAEFFALSLLA
jgi:hypothetical protein